MEKADNDNIGQQIAERTTRVYISCWSSGEHNHYMHNSAKVVKYYRNHSSDIDSRLGIGRVIYWIHTPVYVMASISEMSDA